MKHDRICLSILILSFVHLNGASLCDIFENFAENNPNISKPCLKQMNTVCNNNKLAWTMFDASSKFLISGMTYSNVMDYGNFPECLSIDYTDDNGRIIGKFCGLSLIIVDVFLTPLTSKVLANLGVDVNATAIQTISLKTFAEINKQFKIQSAPPMILSKYSTCVPDACTPREVGYYYLYGQLEKLCLLIYTDLPCETVYSNTEWEWGDIVFVVFLSLVVVIMIASTLYDVLCQNFQTKPRHPILLSFSILYNGKKLLAISDNKTEQIHCFNGMRFISMMWVVAFHAVAPFQAGVVSLENYPEVVEWQNSWTNRYILSGLLAVDTFFFMSGFLLAFSYLKTATKESPLRQVVKVPKMYLHRYLRLTPSVGMMYLVTITVFRFLGSGPLWSLGTNLMKETCKKKWWQFFLYIQNYADPDGMCVNPMWYLSADMQMFVLAPLVLIPTAMFIKDRFKWVINGLIGLTIFWVICPPLIRYFGDQSPGNIYTAHERFNNFLIGITFGAVMRMKKDRPFIFSPLANLGLWIVVILVSLAFNIYWFDVLNYYNLVKYTLFMGLYRPIWCMCLVFMVYSCYHNQGGIVQWLLTRPSFQILGRLSYSMYVLHVLVELYVGLSSTTGYYFSNYMLFYHWCGHIIMTMVVSVFWVLAFEFPMLTIDKYLLDGKWLTPRKVKGEPEKR